MRIAIALAALAAAVALAAAACGGGEEEQTSQETATPSGALTAVVISSDISLGRNRFLLGLIEDNQPVTDADVQLGFLKLDGDQGELRFETDATTMKMTRGVTVDKPDGTRDDGDHEKPNGGHLQGGYRRRASDHASKRRCQEIEPRVFAVPADGDSGSEQARSHERGNNNAAAHQEVTPNGHRRRRADVEAPNVAHELALPLGVGG